MDLTRAVPVLAIADALDVIVRFAPLPRLAGAYVSEPGSRPGILINTRHPKSKQRYTLAHELGHHVLGHATSLDTDTELLPDGVVRDEDRLTEAFASWLLMPRALVGHVVGALAIGSLQNEIDVYRVSLRLGASYLATVRHLANMRALDRHRAERLAAIRPHQIKVRLVGGAVGVGAADVHEVTRRDERTRLIVTAGDLLVVDVGKGGHATTTPTTLVSATRRETLLNDGRILLRTVDPGVQSPSQPPVTGDLCVFDGAAEFAVRLVVEPHLYGVAERWFQRPRR